MGKLFINSMGQQNILGGGGNFPMGQQNCCPIAIVLKNSVKNKNTT